ncbi:hypothetical protein DRF65_11015 [Chryseobacterium pennae]|uniref:Uncharacterized protein n=2 Tax=Chryseobacterium pennae TaxID=2258962 RepID=A0A3D9C8P3_9FLAO|nr:hypothetical protein DRF65_11015 [Chryseobacterium pennae]
MLFCRAQVSSFFNVAPFEDDDYFTKTVFPFNPTFIKSHRIKNILLQTGDTIGVKYSYSFTPDGSIESMTSIRYDRKETDTAFYTRYYYRAEGLIDKKARIDYRDGIVQVSSYRYDQKNRVDSIQIFTLNSKMPNRLQNSDWQGEPIPGVDKLILKGALPEASLWKRMTAENEYSSWQYRYYTENKYEAEERTEYFNFRKKSGNSDTCYQKKTYYTLDGFPAVLFLHNGCDANKFPDELYQYKDGLLLQLRHAPSSSEAKTEKYTYDKNRNLVLMEDIWSGEKVSELVMSYDNKGFLTSIQRKSNEADRIYYFQDRTLKATYRFF